MKNLHKQNRAFTLVELLVLIAFITILSAFSLSALVGAKPKAQRITCINNLKQVGLAFRTWGIAHDGRMPMAVAASQGGDSDDVGYRVLGDPQQSSRGVSKMFLCMSNELGTPKILFCPAEYESYYRQMASSFSGVYDGATNSAPFTNDLNVSYFIGVDAQETFPRMLLAGDHNLGGNANPPSIPYCAAPSFYNPYFAVCLGTNWTVNQGPAFLPNQHNQQGSILLADGSVEWFSRSELQDALKRSGDTGRNPGPFQMPTGTGGGTGCNRIQLP